MRERFTYRGDSLWWFTELYLHKMRRLDTAVAVTLALEALRARDAPRASARRHRRPRRPRHGAMAFGARARASGRGRRRPVPEPGGRDRAELPHRPHRAALAAAAGSRHRAAPGRASPRSCTRRSGATSTDEDGPEQESYIGPVLSALSRAARTGRPVLRRRRSAPEFPRAALVGSGHGRSAARVRSSRRSSGSRRRVALADSLALWRQRHALATAITTGDGIRAAARVPRLRSLAGAPARARGRRAAAVAVVRARDGRSRRRARRARRRTRSLTYAEAGGWGRALVLEARRRGIPSVGLQHGFIYRHWLNYRHEPDEMAPARRRSRLSRFPTARCSSIATPPSISQRAGHFPAGDAWSSPATRGSTRSRARRAQRDRRDDRDSRRACASRTISRWSCSPRSSARSRAMLPALVGRACARGPACGSSSRRIRRRRPTSTPRRSPASPNVDGRAGRPRTSRALLAAADAHRDDELDGGASTRWSSACRRSSSACPTT